MASASTLVSGFDSLRHKRFRAVNHRILGSVTRDHPASLTAHAHRDVAGQRDPVHAAGLVAEVRDGVMLGAAVVPHRDVAEFPVPPNRVFQPGYAVLEDLEQRL